MNTFMLCSALELFAVVIHSAFRLQLEPASYNGHVTSLSSVFLAPLIRLRRRALYKFVLID